jgi:hypothetical protein
MRSQNRYLVMLLSKINRFAVLCLLALTPMTASANDPLTHGIYCLEVMKGFIESWNRSTQEIDRSSAGVQLSPSQRAEMIEGERRASQEMTDRFNRLRLYVVTNMMNMTLDDTAAATVAQQRGQIDAQRCQTEMEQDSMCPFSCNKQRCQTGDTNCYTNCLQQCGLLTCARTEPCVNPTWLPY